MKTELIKTFISCCYKIEQNCCFCCSFRKLTWLIRQLSIKLAAFILMLESNQTSFCLVWWKRRLKRLPNSENFFKKLNAAFHQKRLVWKPRLNETSIKLILSSVPAWFIRQFQTSFYESLIEIIRMKTSIWIH